MEKIGKAQSLSELMDDSCKYSCIPLLRLIILMSYIGEETSQEMDYTCRMTAFHNDQAFFSFNEEKKKDEAMEYRSSRTHRNLGDSLMSTTQQHPLKPKLTCTVCFLKFKSKEHRTCTQCRNSFCTKCINEWCQKKEGEWISHFW